MSAERGVSQDELLAWIEGELPPADAADVERRLAVDPELDRWARGARADRRTLASLGRADERAAPRGLWRDALGEAERRALLTGHAPEEEPAHEGPYRFRLTPVRLVAAAGFLIVASLGAIAPFLIGPTGPAAPSGPVAERPAPPADALAGADAESAASLEQQIASADRREQAAPPEVETAPASRSREAATSLLSDPSSLAAGYTPTPPETRALLASRWAADPNGIVAGRAMPTPLTVADSGGWRNLSVMQPRHRPMPGAFPASWGMTRSAAQDLAADHRLAALVETSDPAAYLERLLQALGSRAAIIAPGIRGDRNGLSAPVEVVIAAPVDKTERALRLCAIGAAQMRLAPLPAQSAPGQWASDALWWAEEPSGDGLIRLYVGSR